LKSASNFLLYDERHFVTLDPAMKNASIAAMKPKLLNVITKPTMNPTKHRKPQSAIAELYKLTNVLQSRIQMQWYAVKIKKAILRIKDFI